MRRYDKFRVPHFQALLAQAGKQTTDARAESREIVRRPGNPMLRMPPAPVGQLTSSLLFRPTQSRKNEIV